MLTHHWVTSLLQLEIVLLAQVNGPLQYVLFLKRVEILL